LSSAYDGPTSWGYRTLDTFSVSYDKVAQGGSKNVSRLAKETIPYLNSSLVKNLRSLGGKNTTAQVNPRDFCLKILEEVKKTGKVEVRENSEVDVLELEGATAKVKEASIISTISSDQPAEKLPIHHLVLTAGPWTGQVALKLFGKDSEIYRKLSSIGGQRANSVVIKKEEMGEDKNAQALFMSLTLEDGTWEPEVYPRNDGTGELYCHFV
jgi:glycine/D-amino acid oxidase-like deaminating enzyme